MNVLVLDAGNSIIKGKTASGEEAEFPHAFYELSETEYERILSRPLTDQQRRDYLRVNGTAYAVGESAELYGTFTRRTGASRYDKHYLGVFVAAMCLRLYRQSGNVALFASHPPADLDYRANLVKAALGEYHVEFSERDRDEVKMKEVRFTVSYVETFDEPLGGLMNVILTQDGREYARPDINGGRSLVMDIGGHTTDFLRVSAGGVPDYSFATSIKLGVQQAELRFVEALHHNNKEFFKDGPGLPDQYRAAIANNYFSGGGEQIRCENEVRQATSQLLNQIADVYQERAGGRARYDSIVLTGGGSAMLYNRLVNEVLNHGQVVLAEQPEAAHLANVRGGLKLWRLYQYMEQRGIQ